MCTRSVILLLSLSIITAPRGVGADTGDVPIAEVLANYATTFDRVLTDRLSTLHWKQQVSIFINRDADRYRQNVVRGQAERAGETVDAFVPYAVGTILVKEQRAVPGGAISGWSMMIRQTIAQPLGGPWRYVEVGAQGNVLLDGKGTDPLVFARCASCHHQIAARDFLFHSFIDLPATSTSDKSP